MTRPGLPAIARRALAGECALPRGATLLVAVSGGPDSMALLDVASRVAPRLGVAIVAHGVDHGLRREAAAELDLAEAHATSLGVRFDRTRVAVGRGGNLQARARAARLDALVAAARTAGAAAIATAHHADDRAETLLLRLLHGAGPDGLAVLPPRASMRDAELVRPLLRARRADIEGYLRRHAIPFATDPSNVDPRYLRTRVRRELLPLLTALSPGIVHHLEALADQLAAERGGASPVGLPRATQAAIARLLAATGKESTSLWLPGGRVLTVEGETIAGKTRKTVKQRTVQR